jgi:2,5-diketo-D-gluconate reductase B
MKTIQLNSSAAIPVIGFGTWQLAGQQCVDAVAYALASGYTHIDTADAYENHSEVAEGIRKSGVAREKFFLTTKVWNPDHRRNDVIASGNRFLQELGIEYIDLLLIHWPMRDVPVEETLQAMNELKKEGKVKAIGVSNFTPHHLGDALKAGVEVTNNQVEVRPRFNQKALRDYCASKNISITAYSSLKGGETEVPLIVELAGKYGKTPAQIVLNWVVARGMVAIPKSSHPERIKENLGAAEFEMEEADLARIDSLPQTGRVNDPSFSDFDY